MIINDIDASAFDFTLAESPGWLDSPPVQTPSAIVLHRGHRPLGTGIELPRKVTLRGLIRGTTAAEARENVDLLKLALSYPPARVTFDDHPDRYYSLRLDNFNAPPAPQGSHVVAALRVDIAMTAIPPYAFDIDETEVSGNAALPLGTGPIRPVITLAGAADPVVSLRDKDGNVVTVIALTASGTIVIDNDALTITDDGVPNMASLDGGDFFVIDPADPRFHGAGPTITATGVSSYTTVYRRSWR